MITVTGRIYNAPVGIDKMGYRTEGGTLYTANVTAASGYYTYSISVPQNTRLAPRVRTGNGWQGAWAPTYLLTSVGIVMDIECEDRCTAPAPAGNKHVVYGNVREFARNGTKLEFRDTDCDCDEEQCKAHYWFRTATIWQNNDYRFSVQLPGNCTYSVYHSRTVDGKNTWVPCKSPTTITLTGTTGMLCLCVRGAEGPNVCSGKARWEDYAGEDHRTDDEETDDQP